MISKKHSGKLNIVMAIDVWESSRNGAVISTARFTDLLRNYGYTVSVLSTGEDISGKYALPEFYPPFVKGIMKKMKIVFAKPEEKIIREALKNADVLHVQFPFLMGKKAIKIARELNVAIVSTFHVQAEHLAHNIGIRNQKVIDKIYSWFLKKIYNPSDIVVSPSQFAEDELKRYKLKPDSVVISNGIMPEYKPGNYERKYPDKFIVLSVGRSAPEKKQDVIIRAIAHSKYAKDIQLILIGDGPKKENLRALSAKLLINKADFQYLPAEEVIAYYNTADLYVHAAEVEVECMTVLEAMGCALPPVISDSELSATKQFALDERSLFKSGDPVDLAKKIDYWYENREELKEAKQRYLKHADNYRIEESFKKLKGVYQKAIEINRAKQELQPV